MSVNYKKWTDFLVELGIEKVPHTQKSYLGHLINVYRLMESEGCTEEFCAAGMFHSIYGTQQFQGFKLELDQRPMVRQMIGERAEKLAYLNCAMQRETFDAATEESGKVYRFTDRITKEPVELSQVDFDDLCRVHLYDWLEQIPRSQYGWGYRRAAYRRMAERLGGKALAAYERVFANEPVSSDPERARPTLTIVSGVAMQDQGFLNPQLTEYLWSTAIRLPVFLVTLMGIIGAVVYWRKAPLAAMLTAVACLILFLSSCIFPAMLTWVTDWVIRNGPPEGIRTRIQVTTRTIIGSWSVCTALCLIALIIAVFAGRSSANVPPRRPPNDAPERSNDEPDTRISSS